MLPIPTAGPYRLAVVFDSSGRPSVLKSLKPEFAAREDLALRLRNEGEVLSRVGGQHHVIGMHNRTADPVTLSLEYCDGGSLQDRLALGMLAKADARRVVPQLLDAVAWLGENGVVHRDVKPANILFLGDELRLADFGVAAWGNPPRALPEGWAEDTVGTAPWVAPEVARDPMGPVSPAADIYSAAKVIEAMLGAVPAWLEGALDQDPERRPTAEELLRRV